MKNDFYYPSSDGETQIHAIKWTPSVKPVAVLQIVHGMVEFIDRYDEFAEYLAGNGIVVVGHDHLGHGQSVASEDRYGFFKLDGGNAALLNDINTLRLNTAESYPDLPYFILGHSMGSFLTRQYLARHSDGLSGAIIMGTGSQPTIMLNVGKGICSLIAAFKGWNYRSKFVDNLAFGAYNKRFEPSRTSRDWLTKDAQIVDSYIANPHCTFLFTVNGYYNLFYSIKDCQNKKNIDKISKDLPVFFVAGKDDPVGNFGKGVEKACEGFLNAGIQNVMLKLYQNDRHEILNETDRETVFDDILKWIQSKIV